MTEPRPRKLSPLWELTKARVREFYREPGAVFWVFAFPVLMVVALGLAFREGDPQKPIVSIDQSLPAWVEAALKAEGFEPLHFDGQLGREQLRSGKVDLLVGGSETALTFEFDPSRSEARMAQALVDDALQRARGRVDPLSIAAQHVTEPGARYVDFLLPGIIGLNLMGASMWGIGYNVIVARKRKMLKRFAASPMRRSHFLLAYGLSRLFFLIFELSALLILGGLAFDVSVQGSMLSMVVVSVLGAASFAGLSLLIAARIQSLEAANGWLNFTMLPMWLLSGSFFSYERFPETLHPAIKLLPLTALNDALRAISSQGAPLLSTWPELLILVVWGGVSFAAALKWFRWQ